MVLLSAQSFEASAWPNDTLFQRSCDDEQRRTKNKIEQFKRAASPLFFSVPINLPPSQNREHEYQFPYFDPTLGGKGVRGGKYRVRCRHVNRASLNAKDFNTDQEERNAATPAVQRAFHTELWTE